MGDVTPSAPPLKIAPFLGVIAGVKREQALFSRIGEPWPVRVALSAANAKRAEQEARKLIAEGAVALLSFGFAGGLNPHAEAGTLYVPNSIREGHHDHVVNPGIKRLPEGDISKLTVSHRGFGSNKLIKTVQEKALLFTTHNADFVDMESHRVAEVAQGAQVPCFVIRAVSDTSNQVLPDLLSNAVTPDGGTDLGAIVSGLFTKPGAIGELLKISRQVSAAEKSLSAALETILPEILRRVQLL